MQLHKSADRKLMETLAHIESKPYEKNYVSYMSLLDKS